MIAGSMLEISLIKTVEKEMWTIYFINMAETWRRFSCSCESTRREPFLCFCTVWRLERCRRLSERSWWLRVWWSTRQSRVHTRKLKQPPQWCHSRGNSGGYGGGRSGRGVPPRRSNSRVLVKGLPSTGSWQDIKDHMRGSRWSTVCWIIWRWFWHFRVIEFAHSDEVRYAIKNLDDTEFRSHEGETSKVTVTDDFGSGGGGRKRSYSRSRSRSRSRSGKRSKSF